MSEWWTYRIGDFLMFSRETYARLFERYNREVWPLHLLALTLGIVILVLAWRRRGGRATGAILAIAWLWVAWAFHLRRYSTIHLAATYFAAAFVVEAVLLLSIPLVLSTRRFGLALFAFALVVPPLLPRHELFAMTPDPTALATIGIVLCAAGRLRLLLLVIPLLWCAISAATLWAM